MAEQFPPDPVGSPVIDQVQSTDIDEAYQYTANASTTSPRLLEGEADNLTDTAPVAFLFMIENLRSHNVSFIWSVSCTTPILSFAFSLHLSIALYNSAKSIIAIPQVFTFYINAGNSYYSTESNRLCLSRAIDILRCY